MRPARMLGLGAIALLSSSVCASAATNASQLDRDLPEVTISALQHMYAQHRYTVSQVTQWYLDRIAKYDGTYRALLTVDQDGALKRASEEDAEPRSEKRGSLWGVPIVIKANTSIRGMATSAGWEGYLRPGHVLIAPQDAKVVERLKAAGAIILGQTNMPDFAASDTNVSSAGGRTGDAYDVRFSPGGSSGGTARRLRPTLLSSAREPTLRTPFASPRRTTLSSASFPRGG